MKKLLVAGAVILVVMLMAVFLVVPVFAQDPTNTSNPFQACLNGLSGDYQSMIDTCRKLVGTNNMPCLNPGGNVSNPSQTSSCH
jgi:hypothetical protein